MNDTFTGLPKLDIRHQADYRFYLTVYCLFCRNESIANGTSSSKPKNSSIENAINFVDVNTIREANDFSSHHIDDTEAPTETSKGSCIECISNQTKVVVLKVKNDQVHQQYDEVEKENEMLKAQLAIFGATTMESNDADDIDTDTKESHEPCKICFATLTQQELNTHMCIDLEEVTCEYCFKSFQSINELWNHSTNAAIHSPVKWHVCNECTESFPAAALLECHKNVEHSQTKQKSE